MAKKTSRTRKKARSVRLSPTQMIQPGAELPPAAGLARIAPEPSDLQEEYSYVAGDLKRALALAAIILAALVTTVLALL